jgi:TRAP-type mannitol/chloroaromatic compound transport system substrate-binding protein
MSGKEIKMKRRNLLNLLSMAVVLSFLAVPICSVAETKQKVFKWNWQTYASPATDMYKLLKEEFARLSVMTNGRLNITLHPGNAIVPDPTIYDAIADGVLQGSVGTMAYLGGKDPGYATIMQTMTGLFTEEWELGYWYYNYGGFEMVNEALAKVGCIQIALNNTTAPLEPIMSNKSLAHPSDFKGLKIRSLPGPSTGILEALGAVVLAIPGAEIYTSLDTGIIDACEFVGPKENWDVGLHEVTKYVLQPAPHFIVGQRATIVGLKAWNSLPDDLKYALRATMMEYDLRDHYASSGTYEVYLKKMKDHGLTIQTWTDKEWQEVNMLGRRVAEEWKKKSPLAKKIIESQISMLKELGRW